jgi:protoporphyrinogen/coproporphyrinogen III oxidase
MRRHASFAGIPAHMGRASVVVVGAGASGLSAAFEIARSGADLDLRVIESSDRLGGNIVTLRTDGCLVDAGTDAVRTSSPDGLALCAALGLSLRMVAPHRQSARILVAHGGRLHDGPRRPIDVCTTPLLSWRGRVRAVLGLFTARRRNGESAGQLVERRFGREVKDRIAEPIVAGICACDIDLMDAEVAMHGARERRVYAPKDGMAEIVDALATAIGKDRVLTTAAVTAIAKKGSAWQVAVAGSDPIVADHVVVAAPPNVAADLLKSAHEDLAVEIGVLRALPLAAAILTFDANGNVPETGDLLIARTEHKRVISATVVSARWPDRVPAGRIVIRAFVGGDRSPDLVAQSDEDIVSAVLADLVAYWHLPAPRACKVVRFGRSAPSPPVGHRRRIAAIAARAAALGGLHLAGGGYSMGLGFSSCVAQASAAARAIVGRG